MRRRGAFRDMSERVAQRSQFAYLTIKLISPLSQCLARNLRKSIAAEHAGDLVKRETRGFSHGDQLQL